MSSHHVKSSFIMAKFIMENDGIDCYPSQMQYFFKHTINLPNDRPKEHFLAYI